MFFSCPGSREGAAVLSESTGKGLWAGGQTCPSLPSSGAHYWKRPLTFSLWGMGDQALFPPSAMQT